MSRIASILIAFALTGIATAQGQPEPLVKKVKTSIANGVAYLVKQQHADGGWEVIHDDEKKEIYQGGTTALAVLALLHCEGVLDDPQLEAKRKQSVTRGLTILRSLDSKKVYVISLQTMALAEAGNPRDLKLIQDNVKKLLDCRGYRDGRFIGWAYEKHGAVHDADASNSQYAMLALWYARQAGAKIDREVWVGIRDYYTQTQSKDGSWMYSPYYGPTDKERPSVTMTIAGLCGLQIAAMELNGGREQWQPKGQFNKCGDYGDDIPLANALQWINKKFSVDLSTRAYYHLYGLERAGRLTGLRFFGEHDWYREGSEYLVKKQVSDGSWKTHGGWDRWPHVNTSFALLFLSKGRTPVVISKLVHGNWPRREDDLDWNNDRNDLRHLTEYLSKSDLFGKKPLAWQTYDVMRALYARSGDAPTKDDETAIVADMRQSPILYMNGHLSPLPRIQPLETALIKRYVENGGFLLAEACCGDPAFDKGIKQWVKDNWPGSELQYLRAEHPVWTCFNTVQPGEYKLMGLEVGCRTIMLYSPQDLSCFWESGLPPSPSGRGVGGEGDARSQLAFRLGANIVAYATGRTPPQPRLTPIEIAGGDTQMKEPRKRGYFQVGQIRFSGDDYRAPRAMTNLLSHVHKVVGLDVSLKTEKISLGNSDVIKWKFLYMHEKDDFRVAKDHLKDLKFSLETGGLLLADACCGHEAFDKAFRRFARELFPQEKLVRVSADAQDRDRLFSPELNGEALTASNIKCRTKANGPTLSMEPFLEGIKIDGRWVVLYSRYDLGCALERNTSPDCVGYDPDSALRIATAVIRYHARP